MRIGIVASSGGSAFDSMRQILMAAQPGVYEFFVATDRPCGIEALCHQNRIAHRRLETSDNQDFSIQARAWFESVGGVDIVLLYFLRLVTQELFGSYPTFNIHPSLLPAFAGFQPLQRAHKQQVRFIGATAHLVDDKPDNGPIVAQVIMPVSPADDLQKLNRYSFVQKVYLSVLLVEMRRQGRLVRDNCGQVAPAANLLFSDRCNPLVQDPALWEGLQAFQLEQGVQVLR